MAILWLERVKSGGFLSFQLVTVLRQLLKVCYLIKQRGDVMLRIKGGKV
jgi:hypothetical protein